LTTVPTFGEMDQFTPPLSSADTDAANCAVCPACKVIEAGVMATVTFARIGFTGETGGPRSTVAVAVCPKVVGLVARIVICVSVTIDPGAV